MFGQKRQRPTNSLGTEKVSNAGASNTRVLFPFEGAFLGQQWQQGTHFSLWNRQHQLSSRQTRTLASVRNGVLLCAAHQLVRHP